MRRLNVSQIRSLLAEAPAGKLPDLIESLYADPRAGVVSAVAAAERRLSRERAELARLDRLNELEAALRARGYRTVAGIDEVGRGALAGPVTACAVVLAPDTRIDRLDDSKRLTPARREELAERIRSVAICWHVAHIEPREIDATGIGNATRTAMRRAVAGLSVTPDHVVVDGLEVRIGPPETAIVGGDSKVASIAAASILAKVTRDALMRAYDLEYPGYGLAVNKGYGTTDHVSAIMSQGPCPIHRRSFAPCSETLRLF